MTNNLPIWEKLKAHAGAINQPQNHLKLLIDKEDRLENFSRHGGGIFYDFSHQRLDESAMDLLYELAATKDLKGQFSAMTNGEVVNTSEKRAAPYSGC